MKIFESGRQTGKTTQLVSWLRFTPNGVLVVHSAMERDRILEEYTNVDADRVITVTHLLDGRSRGRHPRPIYAIDNLDLILPYIFGGSIGPITMTGEL